MYQLLVYGYMTYKVMSGYHDVMACVSVVRDSVYGIVGYFKKSSERFSDPNYAYIDWILVIDQEPVRFIQPSAPR